MTQHHPQYESALDALRHHCRPRAFRPAFASVAEAVRQLSGQPKRQGSVEETTTRTTHPCELCDLEGGKCAQLLGVGVRRKRIMGALPIDVYSVGMYAEADKLTDKLSAHAGKDADALRREGHVVTAMTGDDVGKEIRMVVTFRKVTEDKFWEALKAAIAPKLSQAEAASVLPTWSAHFHGADFCRGTEVRLALSSGGGVATIIDGEKKGSVQSPQLAAALSEVYVGPFSVSPALEGDFLDTVAAVLQHSKPAAAPAAPEA